MATTGIINGTKFLVYLANGAAQAIAFSTSCSISISQDTRNTTTQATGLWNTRTIGNKDWEVSCEGLVAFDQGGSGKMLIHDLFEIYLDEDYVNYDPVFELHFMGATTTGDKYFKGNAIVSSLSIDASNEESATYSVSFVAAGPLSIHTQ
jgi:predicted secreted protein